MNEMEWARNNFGFEDPDQMQREKVDVYYSPNIAPNRKVVDLRDGRVDWFWPETERPTEGLYADYESLEAYCYKQGCPLVEQEGYVIPQPFGHGEAGDPLRHRGR